MLKELQQIQRAIHDLLKEHSESLLHNTNDFKVVIEGIPVRYDDCTTYNEKVLFLLSGSSTPMLVDEIVMKVLTFEPTLDHNRLHHTISYTLSMLVRAKKLKRHGFNRRIKYSL